MADPVFCMACGEVNEQVTRRIAELNETVTNQALELSRRQGRLSAMTKARKDSIAPELYENALEVCYCWRDWLAPRAREFEGPRLDRVVARLKAGYDVDTLKRSLWGFWCRPNMRDCKRVRANAGGVRRTELELLMRDEKHVQEGLTIADEEQGYDQVLLNDGASAYVATLCDCKHARGSHALYRLHGHEACMERDCDCAQFNDDDFVMQTYQRRHPSSPRRREQEASTQGVLL
jgi:uncharacterized coiled-coil protein SlyX